jgi:hypothetical protein
VADDEGIGARPAGEHVVARAAVERLAAGLAGDQVVERVAGAMGAALLVVVLAYTLVRALVWSLAHRSVPAAFFCAFMAFALVRSFVEVEIFGQFWAMSVIYCAAMRYALDHRVLAVWPRPATQPAHAGTALAMRPARHLRDSMG